MDRLNAGLDGLEGPDVEAEASREVRDAPELLATAELEAGPDEEAKVNPAGRDRLKVGAELGAEKAPEAACEVNEKSERVVGTKVEAAAVPAVEATLMEACTLSVKPELRAEGKVNAGCEADGTRLGAVGVPAVEARSEVALMPSDKSTVGAGAETTAEAEMEAAARLEAPCKFGPKEAAVETELEATSEAVGATETSADGGVIPDGNATFELEVASEIDAETEPAADTDSVWSNPSVKAGFETTSEELGMEREPNPETTPAPEDSGPADVAEPDDAGPDEADGPGMDNDGTSKLDIARPDDAEDTGAEETGEAVMENVWLNNGSREEMGKSRLADADGNEIDGNEADGANSAEMDGTEFVKVGEAAIVTVWLSEGEGTPEESGNSRLEDADINEVGCNKADEADPDELGNATLVNADGVWLSNGRPDETGRSMLEDAVIGGNEADGASSVEIYDAKFVNDRDVGPSDGRLDETGKFTLDAEISDTDGNEIDEADTAELGNAEFVKSRLESGWLSKSKLDVCRPKEADDGAAEGTGEAVIENVWLSNGIPDDTGKATPDEVDGNGPDADREDAAKTTGPGDNGLIEGGEPRLDSVAPADSVPDGMMSCDDGKPEMGNAEFVGADKTDTDSVGSEGNSPVVGGPDTLTDKAKFNEADKTSPDGAELVDAGEAVPDDVGPAEDASVGAGLYEVAADDFGPNEAVPEDGKPEVTESADAAALVVLIDGIRVDDSRARDTDCELESGPGAEADVSCPDVRLAESRAEEADGLVLVTGNGFDEDKSDELRRTLVMNPEDAEATAGGLKKDSEEDVRPDDADADTERTEDVGLKLDADADPVDSAVDLIFEDDTPDVWGTGVVTAES
ncbi:hypothetical protein E4U53_004475 [Claviceps sorghi]|nr:hypothetical protein E4U53_004475 [Claviceps sorghi]